jgi:hypothetical protein
MKAQRQNKRQRILGVRDSRRRRRVREPLFWRCRSVLLVTNNDRVSLQKWLRDGADGALKLGILLSILEARRRSNKRSIYAHCSRAAYTFRHRQGFSVDRLYMDYFKLSRQLRAKGTIGRRPQRKRP